jgi:hypothetical protein
MEGKKESPELSPEALGLLEQELGTSNTGRTWLRNDAAVAWSIDPDRRTVG